MPSLISLVRTLACILTAIIIIYFVPTFFVKPAQALFPGGGGGGGYYCGVNRKPIDLMFLIDDSQSMQEPGNDQYSKFNNNSCDNAQNGSYNYCTGQSNYISKIKEAVKAVKSIINDAKGKIYDGAIQRMGIAAFSTSPLYCINKGCSPGGTATSDLHTGLWNGLTDPTKDKGYNSLLDALNARYESAFTLKDITGSVDYVHYFCNGQQGVACDTYRTHDGTWLPGGIVAAGDSIVNAGNDGRIGLIILLSDGLITTPMGGNSVYPRDDSRQQWAQNDSKDQARKYYNKGADFFVLGYGNNQHGAIDENFLNNLANAGSGNGADGLSHYTYVPSGDDLTNLILSIIDNVSKPITCYPTNTPTPTPTPIIVLNPPSCTLSASPTKGITQLKTTLTAHIKDPNWNDSVHRVKKVVFDTDRGSPPNDTETVDPQTKANFPIDSNQITYTIPGDHNPQANLYWKGTPNPVACTPTPTLNVSNGWWQAIGGDARDDGGIKDNLPSGKFAMLNNSASSHGIMFNGNHNIGNNLGQNSVNFAQPPDNSWLVGDPNNSDIFNNNDLTNLQIGYNYYYKLLKNKGIIFSTACQNSSNPLNCVATDTTAQPVNGVYYYLLDKNNVTFNPGSIVTVKNGRKVVVLIGNPNYPTSGLPDNLTISGGATKIQVEPGSSAIFGVQGDINIDNSVGESSPVDLKIATNTCSIDHSNCDLEGIYTADGSVNIQSKNTSGSSSCAQDNQLNFGGEVEAQGGVNYTNRNLCDPNDTPAVTFTQRPDIFLNMPQFILNSSLVWQELP